MKGSHRVIVETKKVNNIQISRYTGALTQKYAKDDK